jgi:hypothetical protein
MRRAVITEHLLELIGEREVVAAVFTTYTFEPDFFELEVIPLLLDQRTAYSDDDRVKRFMVRENLRESGLPIDVYYDAPMFRKCGTGSPEMEYLCHGVTHNNGAFHPKVNLILVRDAETDEEALLVGAGSNNLTRAGWWDNIECQHWEEVGHRTVPRRFLNLLGQDIEYFQALREFDDNEAVTALARIESYVSNCRGSNSASPVHYFGPSYSENRRPFLDFLGKGRSPIAQSDGWRLEIISPFFADNPTSMEYKNFLDMGVDDIVLLLPRDDENKALCQEEFHCHVQKQERIGWGKWEEETGRALGLTGDHFRRLHAKVYHFYDDNESWVFVGSVNFTHKALLDNVEAGFLVDQGKPRPLLQAIPADEAVESFANLDEQAPGTEAEEEEGIPDLYIRYDWVTRCLSGRTVPYCAYEVRLIGPEGEPVTGPWELKYAESVYEGDVEALEKALRQGSLIKVSGHSTRSRARRPFPDTTVLVQQVGWSHKPLDLPSLTAAQILAIYAEMSPERRQMMLIDAKIRALVLSAQSGALTLDDDDAILDQFFCEYAEIFRAFSQLRDRLATALVNEQFNQVDYYLTGSGVDSLPTLLEKALAEDEHETAPAPATCYLIMLSALEVLTDSRFRERPNVKAVTGDLRRKITALKKGDRLTLGDNSAQNRKQFFKWFEDEFFRVYSIVEDAQ